MPDKGDVKEKTKKIVKVLPELNCGKCGFDSCGKFAKAVAEERAPCYGCISGGPLVANKVCEIMGMMVPEAVPEAAKIPTYYPEFSQPGIASSEINKGQGRGMGRSQGMRRGPGSGKGFGRRRGKGMFGRR